ncbi:hypothetical protein Nepgr_016601 [Nepenthes gracilis]|uniref:Uncharacterized protein n=1 Tax=Nepenthes gracilis TaxID=150966 RepID=A0AAD3XSM8_NEPGR|nr:hypothetical protein Nepgr_016601 [Nepenthes gracilis]
MERSVKQNIEAEKELQASQSSQRMCLLKSGFAEWTSRSQAKQSFAESALQYKRATDSPQKSQRQFWVLGFWSFWDCGWCGGSDMFLCLWENRACFFIYLMDFDPGTRGSEDTSILKINGRIQEQRRNIDIKELYCQTVHGPSKKD